MTERRWNSFEEEFTYYAIIQPCIKLIEEEIRNTPELTMHDLVHIAGQILQGAETEVIKVTINEYIKGFLRQDVYSFGGKTREQIENMLSGVHKAAKYIEEQNITPKKIPLKTATDLIDGLSNEEDENLREKWIALTKDSLCGNKINPIYTFILNQLTGREGRILDTLYKYKVHSLKNGETKLTIQEIRQSLLLFEDYPQEIDEASIIDSFACLSALNLCKGNIPLDYLQPISNEEFTEYIELTYLGLMFMQAVTKFKKEK